MATVKCYSNIGKIHLMYPGRLPFDPKASFRMFGCFSVVGTHEGYTVYRYISMFDIKSPIITYIHNPITIQDHQSS